MKVFELCFNPKNKISKGFQYAPTQQEKKLGFFYMVGEVSEKEKSNLVFLEKVFSETKKEYYKEKSINPQKALDCSLQKANEVVSSGDYSGKIDIALFSVKNESFYISKIGKIKIIKASKRKIEDLSDSFYSYEPKLFQSILSGKICKKEKLIISTPEVSQLFSEKKITEKIKKDEWNSEITKDISSLVNNKFKKTSGVAIIIDNQIIEKKKKQKVVVAEKKDSFNFKKMVKNFILFFYREEFLSFLKKTVKKIKPSKKIIILVLAVPCLLIIGTIATNLQEKSKIKKQEKLILNMEEEFREAEEENDIERMKELFQEAEEEKKENPSNKEFERVHSLIKEELIVLHSGGFIDDLDLIGEAKKIDPEKIILNGEDIYFYSTNESVIEVLGVDETYSLEKSNFPSTASSDGSVVFFFSPPDNLYTIKGSNISKKTLNLPYENSVFLSLSSFLGNPYFLDDQGYIINYSDKNPFSWTKNKEEKVEGGRSIAIDGSVFVLDEVGDIHRYYMREKKEIITFSIFPELSSEKEIYTSRYSPLLVLDKTEERIIVISKEGELLKQVYLRDLKGLKDLAISNDGKKIYLLVNKQVYLLELEI
ncbi:MAG: hypothetical protein K9M12_02205 [Candidatus Pacebacteria bacterium]|nr:hypothetical protein [Candidatus Paceibacterota bacterium]